jgi:surface antigen
MQCSRIIAIVLAVSMLAACDTGRPGSGLLHGGSSANKEDIGTAAGAIAGGVIGYQFGGGVGQALATAGGALLGSALGNTVGKSLDNADRASYDQAAQRAMQTGRSQSWQNPKTGHYGTIHPQRRYTSNDGQYCREYTQKITVNSKKHTAHGTACQSGDGTWYIT